MKKILMLAVGASQLLLLPQINAANGAGNQEIAVSEDYEIKNGVQGLDRDAFISVARKVAKGSLPGNGNTKVRRLQGISDETFEHQKHNNFKCEVPQELKNRKELGKRVLQQSVEAIEVPDGSFIVASNDKNTLIRRDHPDFLEYSTDGGQTWQKSDIGALEITHMNGKFFAFGAQKTKGSDGGLDTFVSEDGIIWGLFLKQGTNNSGRIVTMAYGNDKYVMITKSGQVLTKTENGELEKNPDNHIFSFPSFKLEPGNENFQDVKIIYAGGNFVLRFLYRNEPYTYTSKNGINWECIENDGSRDSFTGGSLVGGSQGLAYIGKEKQLYYSPSGNNWDKAKLPEGSKSNFYKVMYVDSSFYGDMFVALPEDGPYILLGTQAQKGGITWSWIKLNISFWGGLKKSQDIEYIRCIGKKIIIAGKPSVFLPNWVAQLQLQANR
ncbi:MAG: hypothetical protein LBT70_00125 [Holosporaceae bacterium]|jgi:hypothetical protein|nr:hypothetical protein [Holosporaceae bacterium]